MNDQSVTSSSLSGTLEIKSTSSLLLMAQGLMSFFRNLLVPHKIKRTLDSRIVLVSIFLLSVPQRHKVKYNCDNKDDYKSKPGKEGNTEVENIFDAFQNMSKKAKMFLGVNLLYGSTKKLAC